MSAVPTLLKSIASRRTIYALKPELPAGVTIDEIKEITESILKHTPSAFNSQPNKVLILTGAAHKKVWEQVVEAIPTDDGKKRPQSARDEAYGSIIFFTDDVITEKLQAQFAAFAAAFPQFADHSSGAAQIHTWTVLHQLGLGSHLQHYNGYVKGALPKEIPVTWSIHAQLVFGAPAAEPGEKSYAENPVKVFS